MRAQAAGLIRSLRLRDLVLAQILLCIGFNWMGIAALAGRSGLTLWALGLLFFHLPLAVVVIHLSRRRPIEGGLYQWAKLGFGDAVGFLVGWTFWIFVMLLVSSIGLGAGTAVAYALAPSLLENAAFLVACGLLVVGLLAAVAFAGVRLGRWAHDLGGAILIGVALLLLLWVVRAPHAVAALWPLAWPEPTAANLNLLLKVAVYGMAGLEGMAIFAGEAVDPSRDLPRSVAIAAPINVLVYMIGTAAVVLFVPAGEIDVVNSLAQVFRDRLPALAGPATALILALLVRDLAQASQVFTASSRLPMVAQWDDLLPAWLGRLDRRGVPRGSVLLGGAVALASALVGLSAASRQEAYQFLVAAGGVLFAAGYLVLFAIPLVAWRPFGPRPALAVRVAAATGLAATALFIAFSIYPIVDVPRPAVFALKVTAWVAVIVGSGAGLYARGRRRRGA